MATQPLTADLRATLAVFGDAPAGEPLTTREVADRLDVGRRSTYERLTRLADGDHLGTKKVGARGRVWWRPPPGDGADPGAAGREERDRRLRRYERIVETVDEGIYAVDTDGRFTLVNDAYAEMTGHARESLVGTHVSTVVDEETAETARSFERELADGERDAVTFEADVRTADGGTVRAEATFTLLPDGEGGHERVGVVRDVTERKARERRIEGQRARLTALDDLNGVFREVTDAVIEQSTRAEIETVVCERLASSDSYRFAWVGDLDVQSETVRLRTEAGVDGYLDDVHISVDPDDAESRGPTGRALIDGEMRTTRDALEDEDYAAWREQAREYGFRSSAAIPIRHADTLYGVLNVYAGRPNAFTDDERAVVGQLGEVVGHAIAAVERKNALMSDEVVELAFRIQDVFDAVDLPAPTDDAVTFERAVPVGDGAFLVYGTAAGDAMAAVEAAVDSENLPHWDAVSERDGTGDGTGFELRLTDPPVLSLVAARGGYVRAASIEDGDYYMELHLAPGTDIRSVVDAVEDAYPSIELVTQRQVTRDDPSTTRTREALLEDLSARQRSAIEAAYQSGYFAWPRASSGEAVADSLDVSPPTFHQHLRKAEGKLLAALFDDETPAE